MPLEVHSYAAADILCCLVVKYQRSTMIARVYALPTADAFDSNVFAVLAVMHSPYSMRAVLDVLL